MLSNSETRALYDRYGHAGLRSGGFTPTHFDVGGLGDLFSAFFGDDVFGGARGRRRSAARTSERRSRSSSSMRRAAPRSRCRSRRRSPARRCDGDGVEPGTTPAHCTRCDGSGRLQQVSRSVFGEFVRTQACPQCRGRGEIVEHPCTTCAGAGRVVERRELDVEVPAGIHDGQRIRVSRRGARRRARRPRGRRLRARPRQPRIRGSCARATTSTRRST